MQYAFFSPDGALDLAAFRAQVGACLRAGVQGIAILGLATEVSKLTREERSALLEAAAAAVGGQAPLSVTVSGATPEEQPKTCPMRPSSPRRFFPAWPASTKASG